MSNVASPLPVHLCSTPTRDQRKIYKFYCPICFLYFREIYKTRCCKHYICEGCALGILQRADRVCTNANSNDVLLECPYCKHDPLELETIDVNEPTRNYADSPVSTPRTSYPILHSPIRAGMSVGEMTEKMNRMELASQKHRAAEEENSLRLEASSRKNAGFSGRNKENLPPRPKRIHSAPQSRSRLNTRNSGFSTQTQLFDIQGGSSHPINDQPSSSDKYTQRCEDNKLVLNHPPDRSFVPSISKPQESSSSTTTPKVRVYPGGLSLALVAQSRSPEIVNSILESSRSDCMHSGIFDTNRFHGLSKNPRKNDSCPDDYAFDLPDEEVDEDADELSRSSSALASGPQHGFHPIPMDANEMNPIRSEFARGIEALDITGSRMDFDNSNLKDAHFPDILRVNSAQSASSRGSIGAIFGNSHSHFSSSAVGNWSRGVSASVSGHEASSDTESDGTPTEVKEKLEREKLIALFGPHVPPRYGPDVFQPKESTSVQETSVCRSLDMGGDHCISSLPLSISGVYGSSQSKVLYPSEHDQYGEFTGISLEDMEDSDAINKIPDLRLSRPKYFPPVSIPSSSSTSVPIPPPLPRTRPSSEPSKRPRRRMESSGTVFIYDAQAEQGQLVPPDSGSLSARARRSSRFNSFELGRALVSNASPIVDVKPRQDDQRHGERYSSPDRSLIVPDVSSGQASTSFDRLHRHLFLSPAASSSIAPLSSQVASPFDGRTSLKDIHRGTPSRSFTPFSFGDNGVIRPLSAGSARSEHSQDLPLHSYGSYERPPSAPDLTLNSAALNQTGEKANGFAAGDSLVESHSRSVLRGSSQNGSVSQVRRIQESHLVAETELSSNVSMVEPSTSSTSASFRRSIESGSAIASRVLEKHQRHHKDYSYRGLDISTVDSFGTNEGQNSSSSMLTTQSPSAPVSHHRHPHLANISRTPSSSSTSPSPSSAFPTGSKNHMLAEQGDDNFDFSQSPVSLRHSSESIQFDLVYGRRDQKHAGYEGLPPQLQVEKMSLQHDGGEEFLLNQNATPRTIHRLGGPSSSILSRSSSSSRMGNASHRAKPAWDANEDMCSSSFNAVVESTFDSMHPDNCIQHRSLTDERADMHRKVSSLPVDRNALSLMQFSNTPLSRHHPLVTSNLQSNRELSLNGKPFETTGSFTISSASADFAWNATHATDVARQERASSSMYDNDREDARHGFDPSMEASYPSSSDHLSPNEQVANAEDPSWSAATEDVASRIEDNLKSSSGTQFSDSAPFTPLSQRKSASVQVLQLRDLRKLKEMRERAQRRIAQGLDPDASSDDDVHSKEPNALSADAVSRSAGNRLSLVNLEDNPSEDMVDTPVGLCGCGKLFLFYL